MQSWGASSRFEERETLSTPTKSGVVGLVAAALGVPRDDEERLAELGRLEMAVRVDRAGTRGRDYQTAGGGSWPGRKSYGVYRASGKSGGTALSNRYYLADASFLVALGGEDALADVIAQALLSPKWALFLGRRSYVPSAPIALSKEAMECEPLEALRRVPLARRHDYGDPPRALRVIVECESGDGVSRYDQPVSFRSDHRQYSRRFVRELAIELAEEALCG